MSRKEALSRKIHINTAANYVFYAINIILGLLSTRLVLGYLGDNLYGVWVTITSIVSWGSSFDFGIGNGLRNELAKAVADGDKDKQSKLISFAFSSLSKVAILIFIVMTGVTEVLIACNVFEIIFRVPMYITNLFFCINFVLGLGSSIAYGYQKSWMASMSAASGSVLRVISVIALSCIAGTPSLVIFSCINGLCGVISNSLLLFLIIKKGALKLYINNRNDNANYRHSIINIGIIFFVLQICSTILYTTDNLIIKSLFSNEAVTQYSIITSVYKNGENLFSVCLVSLWSAVTYAAAKGNFHWIYKELKNIIAFWGIYAAGVCVVSLFLNEIIYIWLGNRDIQYGLPVIALFACYNIIMGFEFIFVSITNGLGRLKLQLGTSIVAAILNIPLSVLLAKYCGMGIFGIKFATAISCMAGVALIPVDVFRFIKRQMAINKDESVCD